MEKTVETAQKSADSPLLCRRYRHRHGLAGRGEPGISSSEMPFFKDDRAKITFSSLNKAQNKDEKARQRVICKRLAFE